MPTFQNKAKIMTGTVVFPRHINPHAVDYSRVWRKSTLKMPHFQTAITRQLYGDNVFFKVLIERATLPEYDSVSFI